MKGSALPGVPRASEMAPALGPPGARLAASVATGFGPAAVGGARRGSVLEQMMSMSQDGGAAAEMSRPLPECLDVKNEGRIQLMQEAPREASMGPRRPKGQRTGKELWNNLRVTMGDVTTQSWLGLTEKTDENDETLLDKTEKHARMEATAIGMYMPDTSFRKIWDFLQISLLVYIAVLVPFRIGFDQNAPTLSFFFVFDIFVDIYFITDVYLSFNTCQTDEEGKLIWKPREVRIHYIKSWFIIDLLGCLPLHYLPLLPGVDADSDAMKSNKGIRLLRLARLLKLLRLARINRLLQRYEEQLFAFMSSIKMGKTVLIMVVIGHWMCCLWYYAGSQPENPDELDSDGVPLEGWVLQNFGGIENFNHTDVGARYLTSMYYAYATMTTVGYGDISATTLFEKIAAVLAMIIGGFVFGSIVGTLSDLSAQANPVDRVKTKQLSKVVGLLTSRSVKQLVIKRVRKYFALKYNQETAIDLKPYLIELPEEIRNDVARELGFVSATQVDGQPVEGCLHNVPFFNDLDNSSLIMICLRMKFYAVDAMEIDSYGFRRNDIFSEGSHGNEMYIIAKGVCEVVTTHGKYKNWPTHKEQHLIQTLKECGLTKGQSEAIRAAHPSLEPHVKPLPDDWSTSTLSDEQWAEAGIAEDQARDLIEYGITAPVKPSFALVDTESLTDEHKQQITSIFVAAHEELNQKAPPKPPGQRQNEAGQLWYLPPKAVVADKTIKGGRGLKDAWKPARNGHEAAALNTLQKERLTDIKRMKPPAAVDPYMITGGSGMASSDTGADSLRAAPATSSGVVKLGKLETGDFFGESAILLPHSAKGIARTRSVYGVWSDDPPYHEVHLYVLSHDDVRQMEQERPPIEHMLKPYRRQAMATVFADQLKGQLAAVSSSASVTLMEGDEGEEDEEDDESVSPRRIPERSTDTAAAAVSRAEFVALSDDVRAMQVQLQEMNKSIGDKLDRLLSSSA